MTKRYSIAVKKAKKVYEKTGGKCAYCGKPLKMYDDTAPEDILRRGFQIDHIIPLSKGGDYSLENLNPSCYTCNHIKSDKSLSEFLELS